MKRKSISISYLLLAMALLPSAYAQHFSEWSAPVNLGPPVNSAGLIETDTLISKDGLRLYFGSDRPGGFGGFDLYVSTRTKLKQPE